MTKRSFDQVHLDERLHASSFVATHEQLRAIGLSSSTITRRIAPGGPWQRMLPGVVLTHRGTPTRREQLLAAHAFCGEQAVITGLDALGVAGMRVDVGPTIEVLIPMERQRKSFGFVAVERTNRLPKPLLVNGIPYAPAPRALIDAARRSASLIAVRHLVAGAVQQRCCLVGEVRDELFAAARARTAAARRVMEEVADGVRSGAEAVARDALRRYGVPAPIWNPRLYLPDGTLFLTPDALWLEYGAAMEIDSLAWHLLPADYTRTVQRARRMAVKGIPMISFTPTEIVKSPRQFAEEAMAFLHTVGRRELPSGIVVRQVA